MRAANWRSLELLLGSGVAYECRTTVHWHLLDPHKLLTLAQRLREAGLAVDPALEQSFLMMDMARPTFTVPVPGFQRATLDDFTFTPSFWGEDHSLRAIGGPFEMPAYRGTPLDPVRLVPNAKVSGEGLMVWRTGEVLLDSSKGRSKGAVDSLRMTIGAVARLPAGLAMGRDLEAGELDPKTFDLSYTRGWPSALTLKAGDYDLDVSPHAGLGMSNAGGSAEAGAMVRFGKNLEESVTSRLNIREGSSFGAQARWYVFAAASGRAVGMNMLNSGGDWRRAGMSEDNAKDRKSVV